MNAVKVKLVLAALRSNPQFNLVVATRSLAQNGFPHQVPAMKLILACLLSIVAVTAFALQ